MTDFDNIPQEKFDAMDNALKRSIWKTDVKDLKINYIDIQDFKNIEYISTELYDWNIIWGYNWNWKSSFVEAILTAIQWQKFFWTGAVSPASLVRKWENKAVIKMSIKWEENEIVLERIFKAWTAKKPTWDTKLEAHINWKKISQSSLNDLLNTLTVDPLKLWTLSISEQIKEIKATTWLDTTEIDDKIKSQEEDRKESRMYKEQAETLFDNATASWVPEKVEETSIWDLLKNRELLQKKADKMREYSNKQEEIKELEAKLEKAKSELNGIKDEWKAINNKIKEKWLTTLENLDNQISEIEENNSKAQKYKEYLKLKSTRSETIDDFKKQEDILAELRRERTELIAWSNLPEYMTISDELWILVDGIEYKLLNTAKKIEVAIDLVLISGSPLRMIRIEQGWELDVKTLENIKQKVIDNNFQIFIERPVIDKYDSIIISEWEKLDWEEKDNFISEQ